MDAVLDTNVIVSAAISAKGPPAEIIKAWGAHSFGWVTSEPLLDELQRTLRSSRLQKYIAWSDEELTEFTRLIGQLTRLVMPSSRIEVITADPDDNRVLEAAVEGRVDYIVSGDHDLLDLRDYDGIAIVTPARFIAIIATST
jgi:hypothetical protein